MILIWSFLWYSDNRDIKAGCEMQTFISGDLGLSSMEFPLECLPLWLCVALLCLISILGHRWAYREKVSPSPNKPLAWLPFLCRESWHCYLFLIKSFLSAIQGYLWRRGKFNWFVNFLHCWQWSGTWSVERWGGTWFPCRDERLNSLNSRGKFCCRIHDWMWRTMGKIWICSTVQRVKRN